MAEQLHLQVAVKKIVRRAAFASQSELCNIWNSCGAVRV